MEVLPSVRIPVVRAQPLRSPNSHHHKWLRQIMVFSMGPWDRQIRNTEDPRCILDTWERMANKIRIRGMARLRRCSVARRCITHIHKDNLEELVHNRCVHLSLESLALGLFFRFLHR